MAEGGGQRFTLVTGNAEYELALALLVFLWATGRPGVFGGAFDAYFANAFDAVLLNKKFDKDSIKIRGKLRDGSFGSVSYAEDTDTGRELVVKQAKSVQGRRAAPERGGVHEQEGAPRAACGVGLRQFTGLLRGRRGASSPTLVWAFEGDVTLEELIVRRDFPECVEELLYGGAQGGDDYAKRTSKVAKSVLRNLLSTLAGLHDIGIVHRDVKPANLVFMGRKFKLVDFGAAADLRTGKNYEPEQGLLDPFTPRRRTSSCRRGSRRRHRCDR